MNYAHKNSQRVYKNGVGEDDMKQRLKYLSKEDLTAMNFQIITSFKELEVGENWRKDRHDVKNLSRLLEIVEKPKKHKGDIYEKAAVLIIEICKRHVFASGNRRTAFYSAKKFLTKNNMEYGVKDTPIKSKIMLGIREKDCYTIQEIANWLENDTITVKKIRD